MELLKEQQGSSTPRRPRQLTGSSGSGGTTAKGGAEEGEDSGGGKQGTVTSLSLDDPEVRLLLTQGKTLEGILNRLKLAKQQHDNIDLYNSKNSRWGRAIPTFGA